MRVSLFACAISLMLMRDAHAYLDPGTGSMLMQAALAAIAMLFVTLRLYPGRLKAFVARMMRRRQQKPADAKFDSPSE